MLQCVDLYYSLFRSVLEEYVEYIHMFPTAQILVASETMIPYWVFLKTRLRWSVSNEVLTDKDNLLKKTLTHLKYQSAIQIEKHRT